MRIEETKKGYSRVWLTTEKEIERVIEYYNGQPIKQLGIRLPVEGGLRVGESTRVSKEDIEESDEDGLYYLIIREAKSGRRKTVIPKSLADQIRTISDLKPELIDVTPRTVQNWVTEMGEEIAEETGEEDWKLLSAHDLRRTWCTKLIQSGVPSENVQNWGGWKDHETFKEHYFQVSDEKIAEQLQRVDGF